jgi:triosephosphate isomerase
MRPVIVAGNWKMHTTPADAGELAATIAARTQAAGVIRVICPPFVALAAVRDALAATDPSVEVGAQTVHHELAGAYTGEIAAPMLIGLATWVIVGHSERRRDAGETDALIGRKLGRAIDAGLRPILCVGEQLEEREAGRAIDVVDAQIRGAFAEVDPNVAADAGLIIAYEPVWAIGTGRTATGADAAAMADAIRSSLTAVGWPGGAAEVPVLYGGSVTSANIGEFLTEAAIDGALVGGASLKPDEMAGIVARAGLTAAARGLVASDADDGRSG